MKPGFVDVCPPVSLTGRLLSFSSWARGPQQLNIKELRISYCDNGRVYLYIVSSNILWTEFTNEAPPTFIAPLPLIDLLEWECLFSDLITEFCDSFSFVSSLNLDLSMKHPIFCLSREAISLCASKRSSQSMFTWVSKCQVQSSLVQKVSNL